MESPRQKSGAKPKPVLNDEPSVTRGDQTSHRRWSRLVRATFFTANDIRSVWRIALFLVLLVSLRVGQYFTLTKRLSHGWMQSSTLFFIEECARVATVFTATGVLTLVEKRKLTDYGLGGTRCVRLCLAGAMCGLLTLSILVGALHLSGVLTLTVNETGASVALMSGLRWLLVFLAVAVFEEMTLRGYLQYALTRMIGFWWAGLFWSVIFMLMHLSNEGESIVGLVQTGCIALFFCLSLLRTGSLWWAIGFHAMWDWSESYLYGTPDSGVSVPGHLFTASPHGPTFLSGGNTGPEGSILSLFVLIVPTIVLWLGYREPNKG